MKMTKVIDFEKLFYSLYPSLCKKAYRYVANTEVCEDIVQECFIKYWEIYEQKTAVKNPTSYLNTAVKNNCIDYLRKEKYKSSIEEEKLQKLLITNEPDNENETTQIIEEEVISQALSLLPNKCRQIFELSKIQLKSYSEIATLLEISTKTVENQMGKALKIMRQFVKNNPHFFYNY